MILELSGQGPLSDGTIERYHLALVVGLQARALLREDPDDIGAVLGFMVAAGAVSAIAPPPECLPAGTGCYDPNCDRCWEPVP